MYVHYILLGLLGYTQKAEPQGEYDIRKTSLLELTCRKLMTLISMALLVYWVPGSCLLGIDGLRADHMIIFRICYCYQYGVY